jgi:Ca2+/Na+ antiporter
MRSSPTLPEAAGSPVSRLRTARVVGAAVLGSLLACLAVVEGIRAAYRPFFGLARLAGNRTAFRFGVYLGAAAAIIAVRAVSGLAARRSDTETDEARLRRVFTVSVAGLALAEVPAVLGLTLFLLGGYNRDFYVLLFASLVLAFMYFPRASVWEARLASSRRTCPF